MKNFNFKFSLRLGVSLRQARWLQISCCELFEASFRLWIRWDGRHADEAVKWGAQKTERKRSDNRLA